MSWQILFFFAHLPLLTATIPFDGLIHHSSDGSSYAFLSPPEPGDHASFIEQLSPSGSLAVAYFTGGEGTPNCSIAVSVLPFGSNQFTPGVIVSERAKYSNQNPVLYWDNKTQILHLYHSSQPGNSGETKAEIWHLQSSNQGITWSTPQPFYTMPGAFDRNRIIPTEKNDGVIFPCYNTTTNGGYSFILRTDSNSSTWKRTDIAKSNDLVQPSIIRLKNSSQLRTFFRDRNAVSIYYADSIDDGLTWTTPKATVLPNNNAGIHAYVLKSGAVLMAFNNHKGTSQPRSPLTVALSNDDGMTWSYHRDVQIHDDDSGKVGEYSYPSVLQSSWVDSDGNDIHMVYTYDRETIKYLRFNEDWVKQKN